MDVPYHTAAWRLPHQGIVITLLPLFSPPPPYILLDTGIWRGNDLFFLPDLGIHVTEYLCFAGKHQETSGHTVGRRRLLHTNHPTNRLLGRKSESCNFSALVMAQGGAPLFVNTPKMTSCFNVGRAVRYLPTGSCIQPIRFDGASQHTDIAILVDAHLDSSIHPQTILL